jgi:hypothetical protein
MRYLCSGPRPNPAVLNDVLELLLQEEVFTDTDQDLKLSSEVYICGCHSLTQPDLSIIKENVPFDFNKCWSMLMM